MAWTYAEQTFEDVPQCPVCGQANKIRRAIDRYDFPVSLSACSRCGLLYLNPRMTHESYATFYQEAYRDLVKAWEVSLHKSYDMEAIDRRRGIDLGGFLKHRCRAPARILDVGGGTGALTQGVAEALGCDDVTVIDPCAAELTLAADRTFQTRVGLIETMPPSDSHYDLILCVQTSDHWLNPMAALTWLRGALAPKGTLWIDMLDTYAVFKAQPLTCWKIDHPLYWSQKSFPAALGHAGWAVKGTASQVGRIAGQHVSYLCH
jgi:SAM-dependent methyltransferase